MDDAMEETVADDLASVEPHPQAVALLARMLDDAECWRRSGSSCGMRTIWPRALAGCSRGCSGVMTGLSGVGAAACPTGRRGERDE